MDELVLSRYFNNNSRFAEVFSRTGDENKKLTSTDINKSLRKVYHTHHNKLKRLISFCEVPNNDERRHKIITESTEDTGFPGFVKEEKDYSCNRFNMVDIFYKSAINEFRQRNYIKDALKNDNVALLDCNNNLHPNNKSKYFKNVSKTFQSFEKLTLPRRVDQKSTKESTNHFIKNLKKLPTSIHNTELEKPKEFKDNMNKIIDIDYEKEYFRALSINCRSNSNTNDEINMSLKNIPWIPPRSPHNLIEEVLYHDPWALLVATIFLNKTSCKLARPHIFWFLVENPGPMTVMDRFPKDLEKYFENLGLKNARAVQVWRMTNEYLQKNWKKPSDLYGIGNYGECAYRMFYLGDFSVEPKDRFLRIYKDWYNKIMKKNLKF